MSFKKDDLKKSGHGKDIEKMSDLIKGSKDLVKVQNWSMGETIDIKIDKLKPFSQHKFEINHDKVEEYAESIKEQGLHIPIIVWDKSTSESGEYEILAGHHRVEACKLLGWEKIPAIIKKVDLEDAKDIVNYTNAMQRSFESLKLYEKCAVINQMKENRDKQMEKHPERFSNENEEVSKEKLSGTRALGREFGVSKSLVAVYLTLYKTFTEKQFKYMEDIDKKKKIFDVNTGMVLCRLPKKVLKDLFDFVDDVGTVKKISKMSADKFVMIYNNKGELTERDFNKVLFQDQEKEKQNKPISIKRELLKDYFDEDATEEEIMNEIIELLKNQKR